MKINNQLQKLRDIETGINRNLFFICASVTLVAMVMVALEFFTRGAFPPIQIGFFYIVVLIIYSLHKEMVRWLGQSKVERQGEYFVYVWVGLTTVLYLVNFLSKDYFAISPLGEKIPVLRDASTITLEVLAIFIFTRILKLLRIILTKKKILNHIKKSE
ncbi:MAG: hypothetical protein HYW69_01590 [Candidatus Nealsonbacteria bacterium]|nr:hypothetical protein [Candidatus Nealsonbacteria bacterium]